MINITRESVARAMFGARVAEVHSDDAPQSTTWEEQPEEFRRQWLRFADAFIARVNITVTEDFNPFLAGTAEPPKSVFVPTPLATLYAVHDALASLTFDEFHAALTTAFGTPDESYARGVWVQFQNSPVWFLQSRTPQSQAEALFAAAMLKMARGGA